MLGVGCWLLGVEIDGRQGIDPRKVAKNLTPRRKDREEKGLGMSLRFIREVPVCRDESHPNGVLHHSPASMAGSDHSAIAPSAPEVRAYRPERPDARPPGAKKPWR